MATAIERVRSTVKWTSGLNLAAGIWLILAPFLLAYSDVTAAVWNDVVVGVAVAALASTRVARPLQLEGISWTNVVLGLWLLVAPFALGYAATAPAMWNDITLGVIVLVLGTWSALTSRGHEPSAVRESMST